MSIAIRAEFEEVRRLGFAAIANAFAGISTPFGHPARMIILQNMTDALLTFSDDGILDKIDLLPGSHIILDMTSNKTIDQGFTISQGTKMYVRWVDGAPTLGRVSLSVIYGTTGL
jgi:hypothetical protein